MAKLSAAKRVHKRRAVAGYPSLDMRTLCRHNLEHNRQLLT